MRKFVTLQLFILAVTVPAHSQWIVFDPALQAQSILNTAQEVAHMVQQINNQVQQIQQLTAQLNEFKNYEKLFGDPKAVVISTVTPLMNELSRTELGDSLGAIV